MMLAYACLFYCHGTFLLCSIARPKAAKTPVKHIETLGSIGTTQPILLHPRALQTENIKMVSPAHTMTAWRFAPLEALREAARAHHCLDRRGFIEIAQISTCFNCLNQKMCFLRAWIIFVVACRLDNFCNLLSRVPCLFSREPGKQHCESMLRLL